MENTRNSERRLSVHRLNEEHTILTFKLIPRKADNKKIRFLMKFRAISVIYDIIRI